jgi:hypothetical protein
MKWLSLSVDSREKMYELKENKQTLLTLTFHPASKTIRISSEDEKRVFLLEKKGLLKSRTVLRNEYGVKMGQINHDSNHDIQGAIEIEEDQFTYTLYDNAPSKVAVYRNGDILFVCEMPEILKTHQKRDRDLLILTLGWYISYAVKKQEVTYA